MAAAAARRTYAVPLDELRATDLPFVGGKGANLGELRHAGFAVPDGFSVTTNAFVSFLGAAPDWNGLLAALDALDVEDVAAARELGAARRDQGVLDLALHRPGDRLPRAQRLRAG
ncbi:MAG: PEP/pyruvate-binding domain-containing protein [Trueperaceae bacterium]|nr:PEP/pyruvate-binding domain-containing protein [Trueperaceae bacterium]